MYLIGEMTWKLFTKTFKISVFSIAFLTFWLQKTINFAWSICTSGGWGRPKIPLLKKHLYTPITTISRHASVHWVDLMGLLLSQIMLSKFTGLKPPSIYLVLIYRLIMELWVYYLFVENLWCCFFTKQSRRSISAVRHGSCLAPNNVLFWVVKLYNCGGLDAVLDI